MESLLRNDFAIAEDELRKAVLYQERNGGNLEKILVSLGALSSEQLPHIYSKVFALPFYEDAQASEELWGSLSKELQSSLLAHNILPLHNTDKKLTLLVQDPTMPALNELLIRLPKLLSQADVPVNELQVSLASEVVFERIKKQLQAHAPVSNTSGLSVFEEDRLREMASEAPTVNLLNTLISRGLRRRASDMHIEPSSGRGRVRYRIDGVLHETDSIPILMVLPIVTRLKLLASMDIAEKRRPQDGKIELRVDGKDVDIRVSALPVSGGESVVMRFLLQESLEYDVAKLGIEADIEADLMLDIASTSGVVLLTGPTGSGKTTTLYSFLSRRNESGIKIITIEDPVEYQLEGINQVQVQADIGYTFAGALRAVVRQDPDVIMVGEIRDFETASIALQSALTGHLVFSTLHTNDAPSAYTRLLDLGVEPFLLSAAVKSIVAQRLVRQLCPHCAQLDETAADIVKNLQMNWLSTLLQGQPTYKKAVGCEHCANTGYNGRIAAIEYMRCDDDLRALLGNKNFLIEARQLNKSKGRRTLLEDGVLKAMKGITTIDEVVRVAG